MTKKKINPPKRIFGDSKDEGTHIDRAPGIRGEVHIQVHEVQKDGSKKLVEEFSEKNMIVAKAPLILANCLGGISADYVINRIEWGTGGHVTGDPTTPVPPDATDLVLEEPVGPGLYTTVTPTAGDTYVQFEAEMDSATGNGNVYTEIGLIITGASKLMFARKTFPGITKTADRVLTVRWIISFIQSSTSSDCQGVGLFGQLSPILQYLYTIPASPLSYTAITVPLVWPSGLNRLFVYRNGKRIFNGEAYTENYPTGIMAITPQVVPGEVFVFEVME